MRHRHQKYSSFGLKPGPRKALIRGLAESLVQHERIKTTLPRAKETCRVVEKALTLSKEGSVSSRRLLLSQFPKQELVSKMLNTLGVRFKDRKGGFTRIVKLGRRFGDQAEMVYLEFVDYDPSEKNVSEKKETPSLQKKKIYLKKKKVKKRLRKIQQESRRINRPS